MTVVAIDAALAARLAGDGLLLPGEVARIFRVDPKTVTRWVNAKKLDSVLTPGGHRRIPAAEVRAFLAGRDGSGGGAV